MFKRMPKPVPFVAGGAVAAIIVIVLTLTLGGGSKSSGPTKAQYLAKADAICQATAARITPLIHQATAGAPAVAFGGGPSAARKLAPTFVKLRVAAAAGLHQLQALRQPSADHAAIVAFLSPLAAVVDAIGQAAGVLGAGNGGKAIQLLEQTLPIAQQVNSAAQSYGYNKCSTLLSALHA